MSNVLGSLKEVSGAEPMIHNRHSFLSSFLVSGFI